MKIGRPIFRENRENCSIILRYCSSNAMEIVSKNVFDKPYFNLQFGIYVLLEPISNERGEIAYNVYKKSITNEKI